MKNESIEKLVSNTLPSQNIAVELFYYDGDHTGNCSFGVSTSDNEFFVEINPLELETNGFNVPLNAVVEMLNQQSKIMDTTVSNIKEIAPNTFTYLKDNVEKTLTVNMLDKITYMNSIN